MAEVKSRPLATCSAPDCGAPLIGTLAWPKHEFICLECGRLYGFLDPKPAEATPALQARYDQLKAEWDEHAGPRLIPPRSWRLDTCDKCHSGGEPHRAHATEQELADHQEAMNWLLQRVAG